MRIIVHQFAGVAVSLVVATVMAQQRPTPAEQEQTRPQERQELRQEQRQERQELRQQQRGETGQRESSLESHIANCLILGNQAEIAILRMGTEQSENDEVKQLAEKMIQDHEQYVQKLEQFASRSASQLALDGREAAERRDTGLRRERRARAASPADQARPDAPRRQVQRDDTGEERGARREVRRGGGPGEDRLMDEIIRFEQKCAEEFVSLVKDELKEKEGSEFDHAFVGLQIGAHVAMLAKLNTAEDSASSDFQEVIREGQKTTEEHKQELEKLKEELMSGSND